MFFSPILILIQSHPAHRYIDKYSEDMKAKRLSHSRIRDEAKQIILSRTDEIARKHGFKYNQIRVKSHNTRLGSCSTKKNLNFNWHIAKFPQPVMEYVIKHELAHLKQPNHSSKYWREVEKIDPQYKQHHNWIKENAHRYLSFN